jgi:hypothetical protein
MMNNKRMMPLLLGVSALTMTITSQAEGPLWTFTPLTPTTLSVPSNSTATVQYRVTNQSPAPHTLMMVPMTGITQTTTAGNCPNPFTLSSGNPSCTLTLLVTGSALNADINGGPNVCQQGPDGNPSPLQCYQPSQSNSLSIIVAPPISLNTTISASVTSLALKTSGVARTITFTNTGTSTASSVTYSPSPALPAGTTIAPANCGNIAPAGTCVLTITPGATASAAAYNTNPTPITLSVQGTNTNALTPTLNIVALASVYQSGSIGGKVAAVTDQAAATFPNGIIWSSDGSGATVSYIAIYGISETSTSLSANPSTGQITGQSACNGNTDGACDTTNIVTYYNANRAAGGTAPTPLTQYASGLCKASIGGYTDWYLPAICEMGPASNGSDCEAGTPNMVTNLPSLLLTSCTGTSCLAGEYWSSTEYSGIPTHGAWGQFFASGGGSPQSHPNKNSTLGVRCSRALTL